MCWQNSPIQSQKRASLLLSFHLWSPSGFFSQRRCCSFMSERQVQPSSMEHFQHASHFLNNRVIVSGKCCFNFIFSLLCVSSMAFCFSSKLQKSQSCHHCTLPFFLTIPSLLWLKSESLFLYLVSMTAISSSEKEQQFYHKQALKGLSEYQPSPLPQHHISQEVKQETLGAREPEVLQHRERERMYDCSIGTRK